MRTLFFGLLAAGSALAFAPSAWTVAPPGPPARAVASRAPMCRMQESDLRGFLLQKPGAHDGLQALDDVLPVLAHHAAQLHPAGLSFAPPRFH